MKTVCPMCGNYLIMQGGCQFCPTCFWSACSIYFKRLLPILLIIIFTSLSFADALEDELRDLYGDDDTVNYYLNQRDQQDGGYLKQDDTTATPDYYGGYYHSDGTHRSSEGRMYNDNASACWYDGYGALYCK
jgi:hypothetical protein